MDQEVDGECCWKHHIVDFLSILLQGDGGFCDNQVLLRDIVECFLRTNPFQK